MIFIMLKVAMFLGTDGKTITSVPTQIVEDVGGRWKGFPSFYATEEECETNLLKMMKQRVETDDPGSVVTRVSSTGGLILVRDNWDELGMKSEVYCLEISK